MTPTLPRVQADQLGNGLHLRTVEMHALPIVSLALMFRAGSTDDPAGQAARRLTRGPQLPTSMRWPSESNFSERRSTLRPCTMLHSSSVLRSRIIWTT